MMKGDVKSGKIIIKKTSQNLMVQKHILVIMSKEENSAQTRQQNRK